jgi:hypothetical protein
MAVGAAVNPAIYDLPAAVSKPTIRETDCPRAAGASQERNGLDATRDFVENRGMPPPDYTNQLNAIVSALSHREIIPQWLLGALAGWILGIASLLITEWYKSWRPSRILRRALYREMAENYFALGLARERAKKPNDEKLIEDRPLVFGAYEWAASDRVVFARVKERGDIEEVYSTFRNASKELNSGTQLSVFRLNYPLQHFEDLVREKRFSQKCLLEAVKSMPEPELMNTVQNLITPDTEKGPQG